MATALELKAAFVKLARYCAYQERSMKEVREKLNKIGLSGRDSSSVIEQLMEENFLDPQRFANTFAQSKFRQLQWGKLKIAKALWQKGVEEDEVAIALAKIEEEAYVDTVNRLVEKKWRQLKKELPNFQKRQKTSSYLMQKGFEGELVQSCLRNMEEEMDIR